MNIISKIDRRIINFIESFFVTWALMCVLGINAGSLFSIVILVMSYLFTEKVKDAAQNGKTDRILTKRFKVTAAILGLFFSIVFEFVYFERLTGEYENILFKAVIVTVSFVGFVLLLYYFILGTYLLLEKVSFARSEHLITGAIFWIVTGVCIFCYLPFYLYQFPGILTPDSIVQLEQVWGINGYSNHHPWVHTLIIKALYSLGYSISGDVYIAIGTYTAFQMICFAASIGYSVSTLARLSRSKLLVVIATVFYAIVPYNAVFAVTVWKDILFASAIILLICSILRIIYNDSTKADYVLFGLGCLGMALLRSNGWYAAIAFFVILLIIILKTREHYALPIIMLGTLICAGIVRGPVMDAFEVVQPDFVESVAVPIQQVAKVIVNDRELTPAQRQSIDSIMDTTYIRELYNPGYADNVKEMVRAGNPDYLASHKGEFLRLYLQLGMKYPGDYVVAYIDEIRGFITPELMENVGNVEGIAPNEYGLSTQPIFIPPFMVKYKEIMLKLGSMLPVYSILFSIGTVLYLVVMALGYAVAKKSKAWIIYMPILCLVGTVLIATCVAGDIRYVYYMMFALPILLGNGQNE